MRALGDDASLPLATSFSGYMANLDRISYDRTNLNGPAFNFNTSNTAAPIDARQPSAARHGREPQRDAAVPPGHPRHERRHRVQQAGRGRPRAGRRAPRRPSTSRPARRTASWRRASSRPQYGSKTTSTSARCSRSTTSRRSTSTRSSATPASTSATTSSETALGGRRRRDGRPHRAVERHRLQLEQRRRVQRVEPARPPASGTRAARRPSAQARLAQSPRLLRPRERQPDVRAGQNYTTNHFLSRPAGRAHRHVHLPRAHHPRPVRDRAARAAARPTSPATARSHGLRTCPDGDWLFQRDQDATFVWEDFGFYSAITPLVTAFAIAKTPRRASPATARTSSSTLMEVLHKHWQIAQGTADECTLADRAAGGQLHEGRRRHVRAAARADLLVGHADGLHDLVKILEGISVPTCTATDPNDAPVHQAGRRRSTA